MLNSLYNPTLLLLEHPTDALCLKSTRKQPSHSLCLELDLAKITLGCQTTLSYAHFGDYSVDATKLHRLTVREGVHGFLSDLISKRIRSDDVELQGFHAYIQAGVGMIDAEDKDGFALVRDLITGSALSRIPASNIHGAYLI